MDVTLIGNSPAVLTAGILLISKARSFGLPSPRVAIIGDPDQITPVEGPAVLHSHVLASCGVGRELSRGALVVVPGPPDAPLMVSFAKDGRSGWFQIDMAGGGLHPATQGLMRLSRDPRPVAREASRRLRRVLSGLGLPAEPALLDLLFAAPEPPLSRISLALRAARSLTGEEGSPMTRLLTPEHGVCPDPLPLGVTGEEVLSRRADGRLEPLLSRVRVHARDALEEWLDDITALAQEDGGRDLALLGALAELGGHLGMLPASSMLPPPDSAADTVATGIGTALGASVGERDASRSLVDIFRFLGGRFVTEARHPIRLMDAEPPAGRLERWQWFAQAVAESADAVDSLWRRVIDPAS